MKMQSKPLLDSNIFIYAANQDSGFFSEAAKVIEENAATGFFITDLNLIKLFQVITDGRKTNRPYSTEKALSQISKWVSIPTVKILKTSSFSDILADPDRYSELIKLNILRHDIYDYLIADCMRAHSIERIITGNTKDFEKFYFIQAINPFKEALNPELAIRNGFIPYGRQSIDEKDVATVCSVLRSDWLTTGPKIEEFEKSVADYVGAKYAVAVSSGTAALHAAMFALGIGPGDEVIVPPMTFAATANCILYQGGTPVFADVDPNTLLLDPVQVASRITPKTKAIIGVDYAGQPCDWDALCDIAHRHNLYLVDDACHALGAEYKGKKVGTLADMTIFSFHPVKHITTGEGGMITTDNEEYSEKMRLFRTHGITRGPKCFSSQTSDLRPLTSDSSWFYEMQFLGYNYRITDFQCALGLSQLEKLPKFLQRRREIAALYDEAIAGIPGAEPLGFRSDVIFAKRQAPRTSCSTHAYHLYVVRVDPSKRNSIFNALRKAGIGVNVHYIPVHLHPYYREKFKIKPGLCPKAEEAYRGILSLPIFQDLSDQQVQEVVAAVMRSL